MKIIIKISNKILLFSTNEKNMGLENEEKNSIVYSGFPEHNFFMKYNMSSPTFDYSHVNLFTSNVENALLLRTCHVTYVTGQILHYKALRISFTSLL